MKHSNEIDFEGIKTIIDRLKRAVEQAESSLDTIDNEIVEAVGVEGRAWTGESAQSFRNSWDQLSCNIKEYKTTLNNQINNVQLAVDKMSQTEES
ncbi:MAG: WXG100 family type VII secretion target [Bacilli bacterium]|nr:WXG100 family type VII secretion target [Bacilli bacterium]